MSDYSLHFVIGSTLFATFLGLLMSPVFYVICDACWATSYKVAHKPRQGGCDWDTRLPLGRRDVAPRRYSVLLAAGIISIGDYSPCALLAAARITVNRYSPQS